MKRQLGVFVGKTVGDAGGWGRGRRRIFLLLTRVMQTIVEETMCSIATVIVLMMQVSLQAEKDQLDSFKASLQMEVRIIFYRLNLPLSAVNDKGYTYIPGTKQRDKFLQKGLVFGGGGVGGRRAGAGGGGGIPLLRPPFHEHQL